MTHSMVFFWHRFELPALALGHVTAEHPRMGVVPTSTPARYQEDEDQPIHDTTPVLRHNTTSAPNQVTPQAAPSSAAERDILIPNVQLQPRNVLARQQSQSSSTHSLSGGTTTSFGRLPRNSSSTLFDGVGGTGDDGGGSVVFFMNGEVVMNRPHTPSSAVGSVSVASSFPGSVVALDSPTPLERSTSGGGGGTAPRLGLASAPLLPPMDPASTAGDQQPGTLQVILDATPSSSTAVDATPRSANLSQGGNGTINDAPSNDGSTFPGMPRQMPD